MLEEKMLRLPVEKKIGQLFFIGIGGGEPDDNLKQLLEEVSPGGVCLFARNVKTAEQTGRLLSFVRENLPVEPFLSVDEEGGTVDRLRRIVTPLPPASSIKTTGDARKLAEITAEILLMLGFNMNFAPVVDVIDEARAKSSNGLYSRAFGKSKEEATELAGEYLRALQARNCFGCLKHFPGLGASAVDSHEELPLVNTSFAELFETDLFPYRELLRTGGVRALMVAHAAYPQIDLQETDSSGRLLPSSLSFNFITELLRRRLNFSGIVITDDLEMGAIVKNYGIGEACRRAVEAGADMPAICADASNVRAGFYAVLEAVKSGEISEDRIDESLRRIAFLKNLLPDSVPLDGERIEALSDEIARLNEKLNF